jgi:hypothetical protein
MFVPDAPVTAVPGEPETAEPETAEPETAEPETAEPETAEPETAEPETAERESAGETDGGLSTLSVADLASRLLFAIVLWLRGAWEKIRWWYVVEFTLKRDPFGYEHAPVEFYSGPRMYSVVLWGGKVLERRMLAHFWRARYYDHDSLEFVVNAARAGISCETVSVSVLIWEGDSECRAGAPCRVADVTMALAEHTVTVTVHSPGTNRIGGDADTPGKAEAGRLQPVVTPVVMSSITPAAVFAPIVRAKSRRRHRGPKRD